MGGGTMDDRWDVDCIEERRAQKDVVIPVITCDAPVWLPFELGSLPPESVVVLVRYRETRAEVRFENVSRMGSTVDKHRVYPALPVYSRAPYSMIDRVFRGLVVLEPNPDGAADAARYMDGEVVDAFDAWMPCPT